MKNTVIQFLSVCAFSFSVAHADPVDEMLAADAAFASMAAEEGVPAAFAAYAAEDVRMFPAGGASYTGKGELVANFAGWPEGATLSWKPVSGVASSSGDFGYTWGQFVFTAKTDAGDTSNYGKYVTIWRKEPDGAWKFIADIGNSGPAPEKAD